MGIYLLFLNCRCSLCCRAMWSESDRARERMSLFCIRSFKSEKGREGKGGGQRQREQMWHRMVNNNTLWIRESVVNGGLRSKSCKSHRRCFVLRSVFVHEKSPSLSNEMDTEMIKLYRKFKLVVSLKRTRLKWGAVWVMLINLNDLPKIRVSMAYSAYLALIFSG